MASFISNIVLGLSVVLGSSALTAAQTVRLSVSPTNSVLSPGSFVNLEADARDPGNIQRIEVFNGPVLLRTEAGSFLSMEARIMEWTNLFYAVAYDAANVARTSAVHTVRGNVPPVVSTSAVLGSRVLGLLEPVVLNVSAVDTDGTIAKVELRVNGQLVATDEDAPFEFSYRPPDFGSYTFMSAAVDNDGATVASGPIQVTFSPGADNFSSGVPLLVGTNINLVNSTVAATREKNEPVHAGVTGGRSIWWSWRAPHSGTAIIHTEGSDFDTLLAVYQSGQRTAALTNLVTVAANDDDPWAKPASKAKFSVAAGTTYYLVVDGREGAGGNARLSLTLSSSTGPINDMLGAATRWTASWEGTNIGATKEDGEPAHAGNAGGASIWFRFDSSISTAPIEVSTLGSGFDTLLAVYTNGVFSNLNSPPFPMSNLRLIASNDDGPGGVKTSRVTFIPRSYTAYWIALDGYNGAEGTVKLQIRTTSPVIEPRPANDNFANAQRLLGLAATTNANSSSANSEVGEPRHAGQAPAKSVWWRWTAPTNGNVYVSTKGSEFDTVLGVYTGTRVDALSAVASNDDDSAGLQTSALLFNAVAGREYFIAVGGYNGAGGRVVLALNQYATLGGAPRLLSQFAARTLSLGVEERGASEIFLLKSRTDLKTWRSVRTIAGGEMMAIEPMTGEPQRYYRLRRAE